MANKTYKVVVEHYSYNPLTDEEIFQGRRSSEYATLKTAVKHYEEIKKRVFNYKTNYYLMNKDTNKGILYDIEQINYNDDNTRNVVYVKLNKE